MGISVVIFGSIPKSYSYFDAFFTSFWIWVILPYLNAISIDFYAVKFFIFIYFVKMSMFVSGRMLI